MDDTSAGCVFCKIIAGELPGSFVYESDTVVAFMDISPVTTGHLLVVPRKHSEFLAHMDEETGAQVFRVAMRLQRAVRASGVRCEGVNVFVADGEVAGQEIPHVHLHIIPRFQGDGFRIEADWDASPGREELNNLAAQIRNALRPL